VTGKQSSLGLGCDVRETAQIGSVERPADAVT
jgi:hypothetical protein